MPPDESPNRLPTDRESPVGEPVIRGDEAVTGERARRAARFDPDDPESVAEAARTVREFAGHSAGDDQIYMLRSAAACAALVRAEGTYKAAAERAGGEASVSFIRKWARVHDLPRPIRRNVALGNIAPSAAKHIARVAGDARYQLAWAVLDDSLTVREVRTIASEVNDGVPVEEALADRGVEPGTLAVELPADVYRDLRWQAVIEDVEPDEVVADALAVYLDGRR
jgi:hypothetical protein